MRGDDAVTDGPRPVPVAALAAVTFAVSFVFAAAPGAAAMPLPSSVAIAAAAAGAVAASGRRPVAALVVAALLTAALPLVGSTFAVLDLVVVIVVFQVVLGTALPPAAAALACFVLLTVNDAWLRIADGRGFLEPGVLYPLLLTGMTLGLSLQSRRVRRQHDELLALREADRRRAVSDERRRIARDLHDVAAHHLSAIVVRTRLADRIGRPDARAEAVRFAAATAAGTLDELRRIVHVLTTDDAAPLTPADADLDALVATMEDAGLRIDRSGPPTAAAVADLPVDVRVALVRIAGEALVNVLRHRGPGPCRLVLDRGPGRVVLRVEDDGPHDPPVAPGPRAAPGHGITGMRERAQACGGRLDAGPSGSGGWAVRAVLPAP